MIRAQLLEHTVGGNGRAWIVQSLLHLLAEHGVERRFFPIEARKPARTTSLTDV